MKYSVIVPCYNEAGNIGPLVHALDKYSCRYDVEMILVENGSKDHTRQILEKTCKRKDKFKIIYIDENKGYGYGLLKGMESAAGDYIGWIHADLQVPPKEIFRFIHFIEKQGTEEKYFLKGIRRGREAWDTLFTAGMTVFETAVFQKYLYDIGAVPVLFHRDLLATFHNPPYGFSIELYTYYQAKKHGLKMKRYPVTLKKRRKGESSWNKGLSSKIKLSRQIMGDSIKIRICP